jgi:hypothetical protein
MPLVLVATARETDAHMIASAFYRTGYQSLRSTGRGREEAASTAVPDVAVVGLSTPLTEVEMKLCALGVHPDAYPSILLTDGALSDGEIDQAFELLPVNRYA